MNTKKLFPLLILTGLTTLTMLAGCGEKSTPEPKVAAADIAATAPAPVAAAVAAPVAAPAAASAPTASAGDLVNGEKVYSATCLACHGAGVLGAPKFGDKAAWQPRIAKGADTLHNHALGGFLMMPSMGGNPALSDRDVMDAVDYMVSKAS